MADNTLDTMTPQQLQTLQAGGYLTPELVQQIQARQGGDGAGGASPGGGGAGGAPPGYGDGGAPPAPMLPQAQPGQLSTPAEQLSSQMPAPTMGPQQEAAQAVQTLGATDGASGAGAGRNANRTERGLEEPGVVTMTRADGRTTRIDVPQGVQTQRDENASIPEAKAQSGTLTATTPAARPLMVPMMGGGMSPGMAAQQRALAAQSAASSQGVIDANSSTQQAARDAGDASKSLAWNTQGTLANLNDQTDTIQQRQTEILSLAQQNQAATEAKLAARADAIKDVDPDRYWNSKSTAGKIMAGIGVALGAFGAGMPHNAAGGQNYALQIVNDAIKNDIGAQQANIKNEWDKVSKGHELAKEDWARATFEADQLDKERLHAIDKAKNTIAGYSAQATDAESQQKLAALSAGVEQQSDGIRQQMIARRAQALQQMNGGGALAALGKTYQKYVGEQITKGESAIPFGDFVHAMGGAGTGPATGGNPLPGVPERDRGAARDELGKAATHEQEVAQLEQLGREATDPSLGPIDRARKRDAYNSRAIELLDGKVPGRTREAIEASAAPVLLSANPLSDDASKISNIRKVLPPPATPLLSAYRVPVPGARPSNAAGGLPPGATLTGPAPAPAAPSPPTSFPFAVPGAF